MSESTRLILDLGRTCRACLIQKSTEELRSLLENNLEKVLCDVANIQISFHPSLPTSICTACLNTLNSAVNFRNQVHKSEAQLKNLIGSEDETNTLSPITLIYKSFAVLENNDVLEGYDKSIDDEHEEKSEHCKGVLLIENNENKQSFYQNTVESTNGRQVIKNVFKDNTEIYTIGQDITDDTVPIAYFVSNDDCIGDNNSSVSTAKIKGSEILGLNKSTIFINGNISNVIRWADSENSSITLANNFIESNEKEIANQKIVLAAPNESEIIKEKTEFIENNETIKSKEENVKTERDCNDTVKNKRRFGCHLCSKVFRYEFGLQAHILKHGIPMVCKLCRAVFDNSGQYLTHIKLNHPDFKPFACPTCDKNFFVMSTLKKHYMSHAAKSRKYVCEVCKKVFSRQQFLTVHKRNHSGINLYHCDTCNKNFAGMHSLRNHQKIHRGEKKFKCNVCDAKFIHRFTLTAHLRIHSGEKPFACKLCNNKFSSSSYLKIHMRTHTSERPYGCIRCKKHFVSRCALAAHEKCHTGERKFQCDVCGQRSTRLADLQTHLRTHSGAKPYCCDICDKSYKTSSNLSVHKKTHLGLREHVCHICSKAFGDPRTLKGHIRIHTGETPYQCHICGSRFKQSGQLSAHRKIHRN